MDTSFNADKSERHEEPVKLVITEATIQKGRDRNVDGSLGEKCNNCGGFGFTVSLKGAELACKDCDRTGVKTPTLRELTNEVSALKKELVLLKKALVETLMAKQINIATKLEATKSE